MLDTLSIGGSHYINLTNTPTLEAIRMAKGFQTQKVKVMNKTQRRFHTVLVRMEGFLLDNIARPIAINIGKACFHIAGKIEERIEDIFPTTPDFGEVLDDDAVKELSLLYPADREATYPMLMDYYREKNLSKRQCGKIRAYILSHFPNRKSHA